MAHHDGEPERQRRTDKPLRRSRGFGGCSTCRKKRLKCDERRPRCSVCSSHDLPCTYEKNLFFDSAGHGGSAGGRYRRPVLTEDERRLMSQTLTESIGPESALDLLLAIDDECEAALPTHDLQVHRGPFGAFRSLSTKSTSPPDCQEISTHCKASDIEEPFDFDTFSADQIASPNTLALMNTIFDQPDSTDVQPPMSHSYNFLTSGSRIQEIFDDLHFPEGQRFPQGLAGAPDYRPLGIPNYDISLPSSMHLDSSLAASTDTIVPNDAVPLLKHYQSTVLRSLTPFRHSKTPWHVLFLPQAKNCLAALTLGESVDSATLCAFYGTLAISAFSLGGVSSSPGWNEIAGAYKQLARQHIRITLQTAYDIPKKAKYKAILIALLTMVQLCVISGSSDQTETYFLEAEKFIRLRGLCKKKSRKVRLLHHCYAFERILYESTLKAGPSASHRQRVRRAIEASGTVVIGQDALCFRLSQWTDLEHEMRRIKGQDEGENDLHLQNPGAWSATLYPEIFGVPEPTLLMVSLVVRLAKEREDDRQGLGLGLNEFLQRAKAIEQLIQRLEPPVIVSDLGNLQQAMHLALSIYFYRRIYDIESSLLRDKVTGVLKCLIKSQSVQTADSFGAARYHWPAYIAASEALDPEMQSSFAAWFDEAARQTGLRLFSTARERVERIWNAKRGAAVTSSIAMDMV